MEEYIDSLLSEINFISESHMKVNVDSVYFGGGTPSLLEPSHIEKIIKLLSGRFSLSIDSEITIEMNPDDLTINKLDGFIASGVNRIVLGVQTFDPDLGREIGRKGKIISKADMDIFFSYKKFIRCIDIMAGLPGQNASQLIKDLETVTEYKPEHISLYLLSVDEDTPLGSRFFPDEKFEEKQAELWGAAISFLECKGYNHYEISNYALPGFESRHNSKYWDYTPYFGFGSGAHSFVDGKRYYNRLEAGEYIKSGEFMYEVETPDENNIVVEFIMTSLRRMKGFSSGEFAAVTGHPLPGNIRTKLNNLEEEGMMEISGGRFYLSKKGIFFTDSIIYRLVEDFL